MVAFDIGRTTVLDHLKRSGVLTGTTHRRLDSADLERAADLYRAGNSMATVGLAVNINAHTLGRAFRKAGLPIRPRQGWRPKS